MILRRDLYPPGASLVIALTFISLSLPTRDLISVSTEAEFYALSEATKDVRFLILLMENMGYTVDKPVQIHCDNQSTVFMANNMHAGVRSKHIDLRQHDVHRMVTEGTIKVDHVRGEDNISDIWTKNVSGNIFERHSRKIMTERK